MTIALILAALIAGLAGSGHCIGMCGPIVGLMESDKTTTTLSSAGRRIGYQSGRLGFYLVLGAGAGALGMQLTRPMGIDHAALILRLLAAIVLLLLGTRLLFNTKALGFMDRLGQGLWQRLAPLARFVLPINTFSKALGAGLIWGAIPCGMVYSAVALSVLAGSIAGGAIIMLAFWLGTLPALLTMALTAHRFFDTRFQRVAGGAMIVFASLSVAMLLVHPAGNSQNHHSPSPLPSPHHHEVEAHQNMPSASRISNTHSTSDDSA